MFKKGDKIVFEGEPVTKLKRDALRAAGYNVLEVNYGGIIGIYVLIAFFTFVFLQYERNFEKQYYDAKHMLMAASFTLVLGFISALLPTGFSPYIIPIPAYTILISILQLLETRFLLRQLFLQLLLLECTGI